MKLTRIYSFIDFWFFLRKIVRQFTDHELSEHEMITLTRNFTMDEKGSSGPPLNTLFALIQLELKKVHFNSFGDLVQRLRGVDPDGLGILPKKTVRNLLISGTLTKAGMRGIAIRNLIDSILVSHGEKIDYEEIVHHINWIENPVKPVVPQLLQVPRVIFDTISIFFI